MAVELVPIGRIPFNVNNQDLAGVERVDLSKNTPKTFHAGAGFTDYSSGRPQYRVTLAFAVFAQQQEFDVAVASVPAVNGVQRFDCTYKLGTVSYLLKRCQVQDETENGDEIAGNATLTRVLVAAERVTLSVG